MNLMLDSDVATVLQRLAELEVQIGPDEVANLIEVFSTTARARLDRLAEAAAAGDGLRAAEVAHRLRGSVGTYGAPDLSDLVADLEERCRAGISPDALRTSVAEVQGRLSLILAALADR